MTSRKLRITFSLAARTDLIEQASFYATEAGESISDRFVEAVAQTIDLLTRMPRIGRVLLPAASQGETEIRCISLARPFDRIMLFYSCKQRALRVERLLHSAQDVSRLFK